MVTEFKDKWDTMDIQETVDKARIYHEVIEAMKFAMAHHLKVEDPDFNEEIKQV